MNRLQNRFVRVTEFPITNSNLVVKLFIQLIYKYNLFINNQIYIRFEIFTAVTMKNAVFWDMSQCRSCVNRRFGGMYSLHFHGRKSGSCRLFAATCSHWLLSCGFFYAEDGGETFLWNVGSDVILQPNICLKTRGRSTTRRARSRW
jgi:hypothetical protein